MLVENFEPTYVLFEKAAELEKAGMAPMAFVPVEEAPNRAGPNPVSRGVAEVMARHARLRSWRVVTIRQTEPIVFNAGSQLASHLAQEGIRSVTVLTSAFRSRRSYLVYRKTLGDAGIAVHCVPVFGRTTPEDWTQTWHGIQEVLEQQGKLQYYRWWVLPFGAR